MFVVRVIASDKSRSSVCNEQPNEVVTAIILAIVRNDIWNSTLWTAYNSCNAVEKVFLSSYKEMVLRETTTAF